MSTDVSWSVLESSRPQAGWSPAGPARGSGSLCSQMHPPRSLPAGRCSPSLLTSQPCSCLLGEPLPDPFSFWLDPWCLPLLWKWSLCFSGGRGRGSRGSGKTLRRQCTTIPKVQGGCFLCPPLKELGNGPRRRSKGVRDVCLAWLPPPLWGFACAWQGVCSQELFSEQMNREEGGRPCLLPADLGWTASIHKAQPLGRL